MAQITLEVNGKPYVIGCQDGQEAHLGELARQFDTHVRQVSADVGQIGETRLFLMASLMLADEMSDLRLRMSHLQSELARWQAEYARLELRAVTGIENAAKKIESLAAG
ncbi:MAG: cell division protein ZapA [Caulobacteraceae bacterium]|nr:cell division protein ZapA [Caulobacteraceae bacterium]